MSEDPYKILEDLFLGKKIKFKDKSGEEYVGNCEFIGLNEHLPEWELQITIDRTPVPKVLVQTIEIVS